jgi:hypothetical protein
MRCFDICGIFHTEEKSFLLEKSEYNNLLSDDECGICLELLKGSPCIKTENCNHIFHKYCYKKYLQQTKIKKELGCPFCSSKQENLNTYVFETN